MQTSSPLASAMSGCFGGCIAEMCTLPFDTVKVRMQLANKSSISPLSTVASQVGAPLSKPMGFASTLSSLVRKEGYKAPWKGISAGLHRQIVFSSLRFALYAHIRDFYCQTAEEKEKPPMRKKIMAAMTTGMIAMSVANPTDVAKVRLQGRNFNASSESGVMYPKGQFGIYKYIVKNEGVHRLWAGVGINVMRNGVVTSAEIATYDQMKQTLISSGIVKGDCVGVHMASGLTAGFTAAVVSSPIDVVTTRYQNAPLGVYKGVCNCVAVTFKQNGLTGFYQGFMANFLRIGLFNVTLFVTFEQMLKQTKHIPIFPNVDEIE
eukprot:GHVN01084746.1.p1 GENE.GHVN01084746.1~~GHVN01084746.1.p1  ORF type:complete len:320 (+),score=40.88 GHVN01084746.1:308-1267(+)